VLFERLEVRLAAGERVGLRERDEVQVPVRLPQVLDVADQVLVAIVEQLAVDERRLDAGLRVAVPARRRAEVDRAQREDVEPPLRDALGGGDERPRDAPRRALSARACTARSTR
jgi:hypothetical protein